jgi:hypothetical protein
LTKDLARREMESRSYTPQPLPSSMFSIVAVVLVASLLAAFLQCTQRGQEIMLACLFSTWFLIKIRYACITSAIYGSRLTEDGEKIFEGQLPPSFQQKLWRHYYMGSRSWYFC